MKTSRKFFVVSILMVLGMVLAACAPAAEEAAPVVEEAAPVEEVVVEEAAPAAEPRVFALVTKSLNNSFWELMQQELEKITAEHGDTLVYLAPTQAYNLEEQTRLVDDLIASGVDGIVLVPVDSEGMVPAIERVNAAGIPLALANTNAFGGERVTFSAVENYEAMEIIANYMVDALGGTGKVIVLEGTAGSQTGIDRLEAIVDVLAANTGVELLASQTAEFSRAKGLEVMENLLQTFPEIDAVFGVNDEMALGALEAIEAAGREGIKISGFDGNSDTVKAIKDGRILVTMFQNGPAQAGDALLAIYDFLDGKEVPERIKTNALLIDASNVDDFMYLVTN